MERLRRAAVFLLLAGALAGGCAADKTKHDIKSAAGAKALPGQTAEPVVKAPVKRDYQTENMASVDASSGEIEAALTLARQNDPAGAVQALKTVTSKYGKAFIAYYDLGILYERMENREQARSAYASALAVEPNFSKALVALVRMSVRAGDAQGGLSVARQYLAQKNIFEYHYGELEALVALGQYDEAIALCRRLLKQDEANAKLRYYLALVEFERKRYRLAEFIVGESLSIAPKDADALFLKARIHDALSGEDMSLIPGIAATLDEVLELHPDHVEALWMRANIYYNASHYEKAEAMYRHILSVSPHTVGVMINLANTLKTENRGPEAEKILKEAQNIDPRNGLLELSLGTLYLNFELIDLPMKEMERLKLARAHFENAKNFWTSGEDIALADGYIKTTDDAIETVQAMLDAEALFGAPSGDESQDGREGSLKVD